MKIAVVGTRGIPNIQGGVETHCEELYPRIVALGNDVTVLRRSSYIEPNNVTDSYKGVRLKDVYAPRRKSIEAIVHTFLAVIKARSMNPDVIHIHAIGPSLMAPFARLLGMKVVVTNHGPDYDRQKWGRLARFVLRTGERLGTKFANEAIVISPTIADILASKYNRTDTHLIYNGVNKPVKSTSDSWIREWGLDKKPYIMTMGRFVKEKGFHDLIDAFVMSGLSSTHRLVIAGDSDHPDSYSRMLKQKASNNGVVLTGFIKGEPLNQLLTNASLFVLPSYHEGLPIALLEAMSFDLNVLVSDIPANRIPELTDTDFFETANVVKLCEALKAKANQPGFRLYNLDRYDWDKIALQTLEVYKKACPNSL